MVRYHVTAVDVVSRWNILGVRSRASATTAEAFRAEVLARLPFPVRAIPVDGGSEFTADCETAGQARGIPRYVLPPLMRALVDPIPTIWVKPTPMRPGTPLALWLPPLGSTKENVLTFLQELAAAVLVAVSSDPWQHSERATKPGEQDRARIFGNFRRYM